MRFGTAVTTDVPVSKPRDHHPPYLFVYRDAIAGLYVIEAVK